MYVCVYIFDCVYFCVQELGIFALGLVFRMKTSDMKRVRYQYLFVALQLTI